VLRPTAFIAVFCTLFGLSRGLDAFLRLFLVQQSGETLLPALARNLSFFDILWPVLLWNAFGVAWAYGLAALFSRRSDRPFPDLLEAFSRPFVTWIVPVGLSLACVSSLLLSPSFPYGVNLAVSLALEGPFSTLLMVLLFGAATVHTLVHGFGITPRRLPRVAIAISAMVVFLLVTPARFYEEGVGQGNMFKYLRMAAAVAGTGTLDIQRAEENPDPSFAEFLSRLPEAVSRYVEASADLLAHPVGEKEATRVNRSMFRSIGGGVYYINAPGPGILLVPAYLLDRTLNRTFGTNRQLAVILFWQFLGALLVLEIVASMATLISRPPGIITALAVAFTVPFLFYTFQIYPELPGGLFLLFAFRKLILDPAPSGRGVVVAAIALAALPWLHQKYSIVAAVLGVLAGLRLMRKTAGGVAHHPYKVVLLGIPLALSAYSIFLYNHALTGSLSPTATFHAAGRSSFEPWNVVKGLSGLLFDRENGLFVFAPIYVLALVGARTLFLKHHRVFTPFVLVAVSYLFVIASFPYWPGAISTMGRYILSIVPLLALPMALVVGRALSDGVLAGVGLTLLAASFAYSLSFAQDLIPSYQPQLFWARALYSDPIQYLPTFVSDGVLGSGPAHYPKFLVLALLVGALVTVLRDRAHEPPHSLEAEARSFDFKVAGSATALLAVVLAAGFVLEHWPGNETTRTRPSFRETRELRRGRTLSVFGEHGFEGGGVWVPGGGTTEFWLRSKAPLPEVSLRFKGGPEGSRIVFRERREPSVSLEIPVGGPHDRTLRLRKPYRFEGPRGDRYLYQFTVHAANSFVPAEHGMGDDTRKLGIYVRVR